MPHAFSKNQLVFRLLFLLVDIIGNAYILSTHQPFIMGTDYGQSIVLFNAAMIMIIYIVDLILVAVRRFRTKAAYEIGQGITDLYKHKH